MLRTASGAKSWAEAQAVGRATMSMWSTPDRSNDRITCRGRDRIR
jgi:hypothetical protein